MNDRCLLRFVSPGITSHVFSFSDESFPMDDWLDQFEEELRTELLSSEDFPSALSSCLATFQDKIDLFLEDKSNRFYSEAIGTHLGMIWLGWSRYVRRSWQRTETRQLLSVRNCIPSLAWYFKTLSIEPKSFDRFTELARLELHDRTVHGDGVNADNYVKCYGIGVSPLDPSTKICVRPTGRTSTVCPVFGLAGEVIVGRQRRGESAPFSLQPLDDIQKLVVGDRSESRISRRQLDLRLLTPDFLAVINLSEIASVECDQGALAPGAAITLPVPCSLRLASCMLDFSRVHRS